MASAPLLREDRTLYPVGRQSGTYFDNGFVAVNSIPTKMDANGLAAGSVEVKVFNKKGLHDCGL